MGTDKTPNLIVILGPTASGKTSLAARVAADFDGEILSADSRQVYRGLDLGTGKDLDEYIVEGKAIPFHLIDIADPGDEFNLFAFQRHFLDCYSEIRHRGKRPILVGGTGLYLESVILHYRLREVPEDDAFRKSLAGLDMESLTDLYLSQTDRLPHNKTDMTDRDRLIRAIEIARDSRSALEEPAQQVLQGIVPIVFGIHWDRNVLRQRITKRLKSRLASGLVEEVRGLHERGLTWERLDAFGLEYRYIANYLKGDMTYDQMFRALETKIHQFAKRQDTWFRRMERRGVRITWLNGPDYKGIRKILQVML